MPERIEQRQVSDAEARQIHNSLYQGRGLSLLSISSLTGFSIKALYGAFHRTELVMRPHGGSRILSDAQQLDVVSAYGQGTSIEELANAYSVDRQTIQKELRDFGVPSTRDPELKQWQYNLAGQANMYTQNGELRRQEDAANFLNVPYTTYRRWLNESQNIVPDPDFEFQPGSVEQEIQSRENIRLKKEQREIFLSTLRLTFNLGKSEVDNDIDQLAMRSLAANWPYRKENETREQRIDRERAEIGIIKRVEVAFGIVLDPEAIEKFKSNIQ